MISMTYNQLRSPQFGMAFHKLVTSKDVKTMQTIYKIAKLGKKLAEEEKVMNELRLGIAKKYGILDEAGNLIVKEDGSYDVRDGEKEAHETAFADFGAVVSSFELPKLDIKELRAIGITAQDLIHLSPLLEEPV